MANSNNKKIAKNTLYLYIRMLITMSVSLYTSRVILQTLGESDFGIYNIVGGIVVLFSFLNGAIQTATQRFLSYELGRNDEESVRKVFSVSMIIYLLLAFSFVLIGETVGLWFLNSQLNIPSNRMTAANWVFQFSLLVFILNMIRVPYNATIISYEKMNFFAFFSIAEVTAKLLIIYVLLVGNYDKLILYSILVFFTVLSLTAILIVYCKKNFSVNKFVIVTDKNTYKQILSFTGWSLFGSFANISRQQGLNIIINIFFGVVLNAAVGIANQVSATLANFVSNIQLAFNPQIVKSYASKEYERFMDLIIKDAKFSYYLMLIIGVPVCFNIEYILNLWLGNVPEYTGAFVILLMIYQCLDALQSPLMICVQASGNIGKYQRFLSIIILLNLPLAYMVLKFGYSPISVWITNILISMFCLIYRMYYVEKYIDLKVRFFTQKVLVPCSVVSILVIGLTFAARFESETFMGFCGNTILSVLIAITVISIIGLDKSERSYLLSIVKKKK